MDKNFSVAACVGWKHWRVREVDDFEQLKCDAVVDGSGGGGLPLKGSSSCD